MCFLKYSFNLKVKVKNGLRFGGEIVVKDDVKQEKTKKAGGELNSKTKKL